MSNERRSEDEVERRIRSIVGSMAIDGITVSNETIEECKSILRGELDADEYVAKIIEKYKKRTE